MKRRGLGRGQGKGYKNIVPIDSHIHSLSARGVKSATAFDLAQFMLQNDKNVWSSVVDFNAKGLPTGAEYMEDEVDEEGDWTGDYDIETFRYAEAKRDMKKYLKEQLKKIGATNIVEKKGTYDLDIIYKFEYDGEEYEIRGIKHLYSVDSDEEINNLWNWHVHGYPDFPEKAYKRLGVESLDAKGDKSLSDYKTFEEYEKENIKPFYRVFDRLTGMRSSNKKLFERLSKEEKEDMKLFGINAKGRPMTTEKKIIKRNNKAYIRKQTFYGRDGEPKSVTYFIGQESRFDNVANKLVGGALKRVNPFYEEGDQNEIMATTQEEALRVFKSLSAKGKRAYFRTPKGSKRLKVQQAVTVPSTEFDEPIPKWKFEKRVDDVQKWLSKTYGGETTITGQGGYMSDSGKLIEEPVVVVTAFADTKKFNKNKDVLVDRLKQWKDDWKQESVAYQYEDDLFFIK